MKKIVLLLLALSLIATLFAGCGKEEIAETPDNVVEEPSNTEPSDVVADSLAKEDIPLDTPLKPETPSTKPQAPTTKPQTPATKPETPVAAPEQKPANTTPIVPDVKEYSLSEIHTLIKNTYGEDYRPNIEIPAESLKDLFGINLDDVEEYIAEQPMISANIDTFIAIKAKQGKAENVKAALDTYKDSLLNGAMMYPSNMPKAQAAKVVRHANFVFLVMLGASGDMEADEATQLAFANAQVEKGVKALDNYFVK